MTRHEYSPVDAFLTTQEAITKSPLLASGPGPERLTPGDLTE